MRLCVRVCVIPCVLLLCSKYSVKMACYPSLICNGLPRIIDTRISL